MSLDKILQKIQSEIKDLAPTLELFFEDTIQPSVNDCEDLQKQLVSLQEHLAVYKYQKQNKELSPSFNIHAKVSGAQLPEEKVTAPAPEIKKETLAEEKPPVQEIQKPAEQSKRPMPARTPSKMAINLNDKFRFINELFAQNSSEYNIAIEQLHNLDNWNDTEIYLNSLRSLYSWEEDKEIVSYFYALVKKRFD